MNKHWVYPANEDLVSLHLRALTYTNPRLRIIPSQKVVYNSTSKGGKFKVAIISGGGSGHEPIHAGYVGENCLDAAVAGSIFASPSTAQIMAAVKTVASKDRGAVLVVKNYTGDVLHFGLVAERAKALGYPIEIVTVADDVAVGRKQNNMVGRRGLAGTAIVHKVLGGLLAQGTELAELASIGRSLVDSIATLGVSLDRTSVPGKVNEDIEFTKIDEIELGLGIHNEPGTISSPIPDTDSLLDEMYKILVSSDDGDRHYVDFDLANDEYVLLVNNLGGTSSLELYAIAEHAISRLPLKRLPIRVLVGDFITSLNAPGFSLTLLNVSKFSRDNSLSVQQVMALIDTPTDAPGWRAKLYSASLWDEALESIEEPFFEDKDDRTSSLRVDPDLFRNRLQRAMNEVKKQEPKITLYDTIVGDGDCGETMVAGADAILHALQSDVAFQQHLNDPIATITAITDLVENSMGGTSGGLYSIFLTSLGHALKGPLNIENIGHAFHSALYDGLFKYTKARRGGRTMVDTLQPFCDTLSETLDLCKALDAAKNGCKQTRKLQAKFGRASYVDAKDLRISEGGIPDPGAVALLAILEGFLA